MAKKGKKSKKDKKKGKKETKKKYWFPAWTAAVRLRTAAVQRARSLGWTGDSGAAVRDGPARWGRGRGESTA
jgi:hypothetical protein